MLVAIAPVFWYPLRCPLVTLLLLPAIPAAWCLRKFKYGRLFVDTGLEAPLCFLLFTTSISTVAVVDWQLGLPKVLGMALGCATVIAIGNVVGSGHAVQNSIVALAAAVGVLAFVGLVGVDWQVSKYAPLQHVYLQIHMLIHGIVEHAPRDGIHPNELAGTLVLVLPVSLAQGGVLLARRGDSRRVSLVAGGPRRVGRSTPQWLALLAGLVALGMLVLTQSRSALIASAVAITFLVGIGARSIVASARVRVSMRVFVIFGFGTLVLVTGWAAWQLVIGWAGRASASTYLDTFSGRLELWDRATRMLGDFPFTGIGLGQFNPVLHALYFPFLIRPDEFVPHSHNVLLEYAVELGLPGFAAFGALLCAFFVQCARAARAVDELVRWTGVGLALGVVAFLGYGMVDAIAPGARAGIVLWIVLGLGGAVGNLGGDGAARSKGGC